jgi:AcrR family transcriptional regulator
MEEIHPTKKLIFDAITQLLIEGGVDQVTYSNISARTYLQRASIAYHFKGRQDMLMKYFEHYLAVTDPLDLITEVLEPAADDVVVDFCRVIDFILLNRSMRDSEIGPLYRHVLATALFDPQAKRLLQQNNERSDVIVQRVLDHYIKKGIIEESRIEAAVADMYAFAACSSFIQLFDLDVPRYGLALDAMLERVKRLLLKDGLYPPAIN